jgi:S-adenosylmethionine:tRNA ribosyltransferase-isomerase
MHPSDLAIADFTYDLPDERIALYPLAQRDASKLLVYKGGQISETIFTQLPNQLPKNSFLVFNETRVISARLFFENRNNKRIEIFCLEPAEEIGTPYQGLERTASVRWKCMVGHLKSWKEEVLELVAGDLKLQAKKISREAALVEIEFNWTPEEYTFAQVLEICGQLPIPPYLNRATEESDNKQYQTVYSRKEGSVAAPTAGLHFTSEVFKALEAKNIQTAQLVLHVGAGTFQPVKAEKIADHQMHAEYIEISRQLIERLLDQSDEPVIAVGTTSLRSLESLYWMGCKVVRTANISIEALEVQQWEAYSAEYAEISKSQSLKALLRWMRNHDIETLVCKTRILIAPPYELKIASGIITNFHQPQSTLLLLIAAVIGDNWRKVYDYALAHDFRFLSYGDSSLLLK